tara:strand:+ start:15938 stop:16630 length:693 start_codon:yes stop_codon:yes gene_type:complete
MSKITKIIIMSMCLGIVAFLAACMYKAELTPREKRTASWYNKLAEEPMEKILYELELMEIDEFKPTPFARPLQSSDTLENSLAYLWGTNYTVHRIDHRENFQIVNSQYFMNMPVLLSILTHFGQDTTSFTDSYLDTLTVNNLSNYLGNWGNIHELALDTIYKDFWNSHGTICFSPNLNFIDANSTKWDEETGISSSPEPHKSFTIMIPTEGSGSEIIYHLINNSNPPSKY